MAHPTNQRRFFTRNGAEIEPAGVFAVLSVGMCTGALSAACLSNPVASSSLCTLLFDGSALRTKLPEVFLFCGGFHATAFLLGSTYYGFFLLPLLSALFGWFIYRIGALALAENTFSGVISGSFSFLLPALLLVPCFFIVAVEAFSSSRMLQLLVSRRSIPLNGGRGLHFLFCIPFLALAALCLFFFGSP